MGKVIRNRATIPTHGGQRMLIIFGGLPGTGKTTIATELARRIEATYLRIDSIEQVLRQHSRASLPIDAGYRIAYAIAEDNLRIGRTLVADSVNPLKISRDAWTEVARRAGAKSVEIEIVCSDPQEHRHRVETRTTDIADLTLPDWQKVMSREYEAWDRERIVIDTAKVSAADSVLKLQELLAVRQDQG